MPTWSEILKELHETTKQIDIFSGTPSAKIIENHNGRAFIKMFQQPVFVQRKA